ncbi:MAG: DUF2846 domain-containing protein [Opitutaceae bacterium]|jgi:hypothetical protein|nr:DUF2846 domain-containing protein [Opitutaceae bacterium]
MRSFLLIFSFSILLYIPGCNTPPTHAPPVVLGDDAATVVVFREYSPPVALKGVLSIDGNRRAVLGGNRYAAVKVAPGRHEVKVGFPAWSGMPSQKLIVDSEPRTTRYFFYTATMGFMPVPPVPVTTIRPRLVEINEVIGKKLMGDYGMAVAE